MSLPSWTNIYAWGKEIVLGLPSLNIAQRMMIYAFLSTAAVVLYLAILPRIDCKAFEIKEACDWISSTYVERMDAN
jgi:hypothetical protein